MKILEEYIKICLEEQSNNATAGLTYRDLKAFLKGDMNKNLLKKWLKVGATIATGGAADVLSVGTLALDSKGGKAKAGVEKAKAGVEKALQKLNPHKVLARLYGADGRGGLEGFKIDPELSKVIDNKAEEEFIKWLYESLKNEPDAKPLADFDIKTKFDEWFKTACSHTVKEARSDFSISGYSF